ncbi:MAG: EAL domain-containing protein [Gammaproteobacteria bacterium]|nr:EAL domain-containing protein [Gammaproteobacteria bacterium]
MNRFHSFKKLASLGISIVIFMTLLVFYFKSELLDSKQHANILFQQKKLLKLDNQLNLELMSIVHKKGFNYDNLLDLSKALQAESIHYKKFFSNQLLIKLTDKFDRYLDFISKKMALIDEIKSHHSVSVNSLIYLPIAITNLQAGLIKYENHELINKQLESLLKQIIQFQVDTDEQSFNTINEQIENIKDYLPELSDDDKELLGLIIRHSDISVTYQKEIIDDLNIIYTDQISDSLDSILNNYLTIYNEKIKESEFNRFTLLIVSAFLTIWVLFSFFRLQSTSSKLSQSVNELNFQKFALDEHAIVSSTNVKGNIIYVNDKFCELSGYSYAELLGQNHRMIKSDAHSPEFYKHLWKTIASGKVWHGEVKNKTKEGSYYWVEATIVPFMNHKNKPERYVSIRTDISKRKKAEAEVLKAKDNLELIVAKRTEELRDTIIELESEVVERKLAQAELSKLSVAVEQSPTVIIITDTDANIQYVNPTFTKITGWEFNEVIGKKANCLSSGLTTDLTYQEMWKTINSGKVWNGELYNRKKNGEQYLQSITISPIRDKKNNIIHFLSNSEDITLRKEYEDKVHHMAHHDALTGLFNRFSLENRLDQAISLSMRSDKKIAVGFIDMDRFKQINDTLGHKAGDELLIQVSKRLKAICQRKSDIVARIGGDEFVIVLTDFDNTSFAALTAKAIVQSLSIPYQYETKQMSSTPSVGISLYPMDGDTPEALLKNADTAMYYVKENGKANYHFFTEEMNKELEERITIENDLKDAIKLNQFEVYYQPQICINSMQICGVEALIRWHHPRLGFVSPDKFIPIAEASKQIIDIGFWVIQQTFKQLAIWQKSGNKSIRLAVNLSPVQLNSKNFIEQVKQEINANQLDPGLIELEITETAAMVNPEESIEKLKLLKSIGVELAIDDFGTGYSSLAYLNKFPVDVLKLDRSFVNDLESNDSNAKICTATLGLAHSLGFKVIAEGVETKEQEQFFTEHSCDMLQGYLYSRPLPITEIDAFFVQFKA